MPQVQAQQLLKKALDFFDLEMGDDTKQAQVVIKSAKSTIVAASIIELLTGEEGGTTLRKLVLPLKSEVDQQGLEVPVALAEQMKLAMSLSLSK